MLGFSDSDGSVTSTVTGQSVLAYGAQLELGSYATSLIHTSGSAVTRSADVANNAGNSDLFNDSEGVLYAEIKPDENTTDAIISISDGTNNNRVLIIKKPNNTYNIYIQATSVQVNLTTTKTFDLDSYHKFALSYKANDFKFYINSKLELTSTSGSTPVNLSKLEFYNPSGSASYYGKAKMVAVFKEALTDTELACLTGYNNHELYMNYYNRLSYLGLAEEYNVESDINNYIL